MALRNRIRELRDLRGMSLQQVVDLLNMPTVDTSRLSKLERADDVTLEWMERLAPIFGVHPTEIIDDTPRGVPAAPTEPEAKRYEPKKKNDVLQHFARPGHSIWEVLVDSLDELELKTGAQLIVRDVERQEVVGGDAVIAIYTTPGGSELPLLRQFIEPNLLITNRESGNAIPLNLRTDPVRISGKILHRIHSTSR